jgi:hypothetical protein
VSAVPGSSRQQWRKSDIGILTFFSTDRENISEHNNSTWEAGNTFRRQLTRMGMPLFTRHTSGNCQWKTFFAVCSSRSLSSKKNSAAMFVLTAWKRNCQREPRCKSQLSTRRDRASTARQGKTLASSIKMRKGSFLRATRGADLGGGTAHPKILENSPF